MSDHDAPQAAMTACAQADTRSSAQEAQPTPEIVEAVGRAIFSRVWSAAPEAFGPTYEHDRDLWDEAARDAITAAEQTHPRPT